MKKLLLLGCICFSFLSSASSQNGDVFVPIGKYIQIGDADKLSAWFDNSLEVDILGFCNKLQ